MLVPDGSSEVSVSGCYFAHPMRESGASLSPRSSLKMETQHDQFGVRCCSPHVTVVSRRREEFCPHCACGRAVSPAAMCAVWLSSAPCSTWAQPRALPLGGPPLSKKSLSHHRKATVGRQKVLPRLKACLGRRRKRNKSLGKK